MAAEKKFALDIFAVLASLDRKDFFLWDGLSEQERKSLSHLIIMRWMTGTSDENQIILMNGLVNQYVFSIPDHKSLLTKLVAAASSGKTRRYQWLKHEAASKKKGGGKPITVDVLKNKYHFSERRAVEAIPLLAVDDIVEYAKELGYQDDDIKKIQKEWK